MLPYALTISLSAFLLFAVQPVIAKIILPWFGGTSAVWTTCMLFFQAVLLLGYLYAHWLHGKLAPKRQAMVHIGLLTLSLAALPILPDASWKVAQAGDPPLRILALLAATVGVPYLLLASTSPLLQAWFARAGSGVPYRLFALSNAASMLALLSYPTMIEPLLPTRIQAIAWSAGYALFVAVCGWTAWRSAKAPVAAAAEEDAFDHEPRLLHRLLWVGLSACASLLLLAVTTHLTQDIAAIPFLWILPLTLYLLTFIICFESPRLYQRGVFLPLFAGALAFLAYQLWPYHKSMAMKPTIAALAAALFVVCMVCHGEVVRIKPHPRYLTGFYLSISLGGVCGGLFAGLVAPYLFRAFHEFPLGLAASALLVFGVLAPVAWRKTGQWKFAAAGVLVAALGGYLYFLSTIMDQMTAGYVMADRNFYGQLKVRAEGDRRVDEHACLQLIHGTINHGEQFHREPLRRQPVTYFCPESGVGRAMRSLEGRPRRIGVLGLGCGTLAAYGRAGDTIRIYEINPMVLQIARTHFTFLKDTPAKVEVAMGDGRLSLESEPNQQFDILVMDAFSGDSVPIHLITREAMQMYFRHLKAGGILAVNTTNTYLDLDPVMERAAADLGKVAYTYEMDTQGDLVCFSCSWTLLMDARTFESLPELHGNNYRLLQKRPFRTWTDDFSNMVSILR